jgi:hypothetical protein
MCGRGGGHYFSQPWPRNSLGCRIAWAKSPGATSYLRHGQCSAPARISKAWKGSGEPGLFIFYFLSAAARHDYADKEAEFHSDKTGNELLPGVLPALSLPLSQLSLYFYTSYYPDEIFMN